MPHGKRSRKRKPQLVNDFGFLFDDSALLIDRRERLASDLPIRLERGSRRKSNHPPPSPAREAAQLRAVRRLSELFERRCACLGAKHCYKYFEAWLWAVRAESKSDIVPVLPVAQAGSVAQAQLSTQQVQAGLAEAHARDACDALAACAARLADELQAAAGSAEAKAEVSVSRELLPRVAAAAAAAAPANEAGGSAGAEEEERGRLLQLSCAGEVVTVAESHLAKLWALWTALWLANGVAAARRGRSGKRRRGAEAEEEQEGAGAAGGLRPFLAAAYCSLARLLALQGGDERGGGMQAARPALREIPR